MVFVVLIFLLNVFHFDRGARLVNYDYAIDYY